MWCGTRILVACGVGGLSNSTTVIVPLDLAAGRMADAGAIRGRRGAITNLDC